MRLVWKILAVLLAGSALGVLAGWLLMFQLGPGWASDGPWRTDLLTGGAQSDPYRRAFAAAHGLFVLTRSESVYYTTATDSDGQRLDGRCRYAITGHDPDARWWSITAYGADDDLIPNPAHRHAVANAAVARDPSGAFTLQVGGETGGKDWLPAGGGRFSLTLRLYNPGPAVTLDPAHAVLPVVRREACS